MNTKNKTIVKFHVARGGHFNNEGHVYYVGEEKIGQGVAFNDLIYNEEEGIYLDSAGNPLHDDFNQKDIESGLGTINIDHAYDTTYTTTTENLSLKEKMAIARVEPYNCAELLGIENEIFDVLIAFQKLEYFVGWEYETLEDLEIEEITEEEFDEYKNEEQEEVKGKFYKLQK